MAQSRKRTIEFEFLVKDREAVKSLKNIEEQTTKTGRFFSQMGGAVKAAISGVILKEIGQFVWETGQAASDLDESTNAIGRVFDEAAGKIEEFGDRSAEQVGLSKREFQELSTTVGSLFTGVGLSADDAAEKTIELIERAADMASVFNTDVPDAVAAMSSALRGESEPIRAYGVMLDEASVNAKALELGLADTKSEIDQTDKMMARYKLIMEATEKVAGDFLATSDGLANSQRIMKARMEDARAELGERFMPIMTEAVGGLSNIIAVLDILADDSIPNSAKSALIALQRVRDGIVEVDDQSIITASSLGQLFARDMQGDAERMSGLVYDLVGAFQDLVEYEEASAGSLMGEWFGTDATETLENYEETLGAVADEMGITAEEAIFLRDNAERLAEEMGLNEENSDRLREALKWLAEEHVHTYEEMDTARHKATDFRRRGLEKLRGETDDTKTSFDELRIAVRDAAQEQLDAINPASQYRDAQDDYNEAFEEVVRLRADGKENTKEYEDAVWDMVEAQGRLNVLEQEFIDKGPAAEDAFIQLATEAGLTADEARDLYNWLYLVNRELGKLPANVHGINTVTGNPRVAGAFDEGGVVPGPVGSPQLILAHGGETVLPTHKSKFDVSGVEPSQVASTSGSSITIHVHGSVLTDRDLEEVVRTAMVRSQRRG